MADMIYDFTVDPTVNPFPAPSGWEYVFGSGQTINGGWRTGTTPLEQCAMWPESLAATTDKILHARITIPVSSGSLAGAYFGDASGDGYQIAISNSTMRANLTSGGSIGTQLGADGTPPAWTVGDTFDFYRDQSDGRMWIEYGGENIFERTSTVNTGQQKAGIFSRAGYVGVATVFDSDTIIPAIASINSGTGIVSGSAGNAMVVSGFASPVTTLTVGGLAMTAVTNTSGDNYTFTDPGFIDGSVDPGFGTLSAVASNVGETSSGFNVTRTLDSALTAVVLGTLSEDPETIAVKAAAQGLTIAATDTLYYGDGITIYGDGTISGAEDGDHEVWHRDEATDVMTLIIVTIGEGVVIGVGITMRALTASSITMRNLTMRSL